MIAAIADIVEQHARYSINLELLHKINSKNYLRSGQGLTCHDGIIPSNELWLKLGGDKGHGSFKLTLQLVNTPHPNSIKATTLVSVFKAGDSTTNLHAALEMYQQHVIEEQGMLIK